MMSNKKTHGGKRAGAGHPESGVTKVKLSVSVNQSVFNRASRRWRKEAKKPMASRLVEKLLDLYAKHGVSLEVAQ